MEKVLKKTLVGERALYGIKNTLVEDCTFEDGESPIKECENIEIVNSTFRWKYPLWYCKNITMKNSSFEEMGRAGIWYCHGMTVEKSVIGAPKSFRRSENVVIEETEFPKAEETLWHCKNVKLKNVKAKGDYFAMNAEDIVAENFVLDGNYPFDGGKNITIRNARLLSKDAFWNCENVTVYDSYISGEYLGWNSKNLTFVNCTIESLQGLCYIENLVVKNCTLVHTTLAFEKCTVEAEGIDKIGSVFNPLSGTIQAEEIEELIIEKDQVKEEQLRIVCARIGKKSDKPEWK